MSRRIELLGEKLPLKVKADSELVNRSLEIVRERITAVEETAPQANELQIALLVALNLAGELSTRERQSTPAGLSEKTLQQLERVSRRLQASEERV